MKKIAKILIISCLYLLPAFSQSVLLAAEGKQLSAQAEISLLTCAPGELLYEAFGHTAIRVYDPQNQIDWVYGYGAFDFNQPNFYLNYIRGNLLYRAHVSYFARFKRSYVRENRTIVEQVLKLQQAEKQQVFDFLQWNNLPENRNYLYDYFYDNCSTRIRDVFLKILAKQLQFDYTDSKPHSVRSLYDSYLAEQPWGDFGIDLAMGLQIDRTLSPFYYMYMPEFLMHNFDHATVERAAGTEKLVARKHFIFQSRAEEKSTSILNNPTALFWLLFLLVLAKTVLDFKKLRRARWLDFSLFFVLGLIGILLAFLWFATNHRSTMYNLNLLWAFPFHVIASFFLLKKEISLWLKNYLLLTAILSILLIINFLVQVQVLNWAVFPILLMVLIRTFAIIKPRYILTRFRI